MAVLMQVLTLFLLMLCGFGAVKGRLVDEGGLKGLNTLVLYFAQPCLIVVKMQQDCTPELLTELAWVFVMGCLSMAVVGFVSFGLFRHEIRSRRGVLTCLTMMSNCGFMGYPVIIAALGEDALIYAAVYVAAFNLMTWTLGSFFLGGKKAIRPGALMKNPALPAVLAGFVLLVTGWRLPAFLTSGMEMMGATTTPLAMFVIGARLVGLKRKHLSDKPMLLACFIKLVAFPLVLYPLLRLLHLPDAVVMPVFLCTAMPGAAITAMQATMFDADADLASRGVALSTALSMVTIPLLLLLV